MSQKTEGGSSRNRLLTLLIVVFLIGAPAAALRAFCIGHSCDEEESVTSEIPFCSLPSSVREPISAGFEGELHRSPDILGVTQDDVFVRGGTAFSENKPAPQWPSLAAISRRVPLAFSGMGVDPAATVPDGTTLDAVAPTLSEVIDFRRPNPQVRSGEAVEGLVSGDHPSLVVEVVMKNVGSDDLEAAPDDWPNLKALVESGPGTLDADTGSLPLDPAAIMTTVGTGGLPHQHGIVGTFVRTNEGRVVRAWGPHTPVHIIATLPDDLDERLDQEPLVGLIRTDVSDTGLIGGNWYVDVDEDTIATNDRDPARSVEKLLDSGWGEDDVSDVLAVALEGDISAMDKDLGRIEDALAVAGDSWALAVTATGTNAPEAAAMDATEIEKSVERAVPSKADVVEAIAPGGLYLDQKTLVDTGITEDDVLKPFRNLKGSSGEPLMADTFSAIAVSFERYC